MALTVSSSGGIVYTRVTGAITLANNQGIIADTSGGAFTVTLPASPSVNTQVWIADGANWSTNNLTISPNGATIEGFAAAETLVCNVGGVELHLLYDGTKWNVHAIAGTQDASTAYVAKTGDTMSGDLSFSGTGRRFTADFSNATVANRMFFVTSTANSATSLGVFPNGTGGASSLAAFSTNDPGNASYVDLSTTGSLASVTASKTGSGTFLPLTFNTNSAERMRIDTNGNVGIGTVTPSSVLDLGASTAGRAISWHSDTSNSYSNIWSSYSGASLTLANGLKGSTGVNGFESSVAASWGRSAIEVGNGILRFFTNTASIVSYGATYTPTERMRIDSAGNVGIGTTGTLTEKLTVVGANTRIFEAGGANASIRLAPTEGGWVNSYRFVANNGTELAAVTAGGSSQAITYLGFNVNGAERARIDSSGHLLPAATNTYDLGSTTVRWRNIYTQDLHLSNGIGDYTVVEGEENLYLVNNKNGKSFKFALIEVDASEVPPKSEA